MSNFTFAGEHSTNYHVRLLKSDESVLPPTRDKIITMPGRHGAIRMLPDYDERRITLECWLAVDSPQSTVQRQERLRAVAAWLNPLRGAQRLIFDASPSRYLNAQVAGVEGLNSRIEVHQGIFGVEFACPDPFFYDINPDIVTITASPHQHNQRGTAPADPLLRLQGISLGGAQRLTIQIGSQSVTYTGALASGDWLEIDCHAKTAVRVVGATRTRVLSFLERPVFPQIAPGANVITVTATGGAFWSILAMHCRNRWL